MHTHRAHVKTTRPETHAALTAQCQRCMFWMAGTARCVAFPRGIPSDIADGRFNHSQSYPGDGDIRFLPRRPSDGRQRDLVDLD